MNTDPIDPQRADRPRLPVLLLVAVITVLAAQNEAWASAAGTATALYTVITSDIHNRRSRP